MKKRLLSLFLVFCMVFSLVPTTAFAANGQAGTTVELANPFKDVKESDWFYDSVQYARINSFFNGTSKTTFEPNGTMTRGMFVTVLGRMAGVDPDDYRGESSFSDVTQDQYFAPYVQWAARYGITNGTGDGRFSPDALINRTQLATFFVRYFEEFDVDYETGANITTYPADMHLVPSYAVHAVRKLWQRGLLNGDGTCFHPDSSATRAEAATLCMRTDEAVDTWYKEPGVPSDRVRIDPTTGLPFGQEPVTPSTYSVKFYDGSKLIDTLYAEKNEPLGEVPSVEKSSKANAFLVGYFTDPNCTQPFYAENPVTGNMNVYAKYEKMGTGETLTFTSFAQMDQGSDISFEISGSGDPAQAVTLEVMDGSDPVELKFTGSNGNYTVSAVNGFNEGCSYQLHLADGWTFTGKADTLRTASFSIEKAQVDNIEMSDDIIYIKDTDAIDYMVGGQSYDELTASLVTEAGGSFSYQSASDLNAGDLLCIYVDKHPDSRDNGSDTLLPVAYVKVSSVSGDTVNFEQIPADEQQNLYNIPDNFPIKVDALPTEATGTVNISALDTAMYATMMGEGYDLNKAKESIAVGDFVTLYVSQDSIQSEADLYYAQITAYNDGEITYKQVTKQFILESMDIYTDLELTGEDYISDEEVEEIETILLSQVEESGFVEDAAFMLAEMVTKTDGFRSANGIQDLVITDADGNELSDEQIEMLNFAYPFELGDVKGTVEVINKGDQLRYGSGVRVAVGIEAELEVELESEDKIVINLKATFAQEAALDPRVKGSLIYKEILFIPVPIGVSVGATIDIKSFTGFSFEAEILTVPADDPDLLTQFTDIIKNPEKLADFPGLPEELSEGLKTVGDVYDKIEELQKEVSKAADTVHETSDQILGYAEDIADLWEFLESNDLGDKATYEELCGKLNKTNIASDLMEMLNLEPIEEGELNTEYYESLEAIMERYCEMLEQETDWITLVEAEMGKVEACLEGVCIGVEFTFMVRADVSLAIGSNLQYEVGKRYEFWFEIGLFAPTAGSTTMDLLDESFAFQFYVMGRLGLRVGVEALMYVGIGTGDIARVGITAELGPYAKLYGFFIYEYERHRPMNTPTWISDERMAGALFLEFGLYFIMGFDASIGDDLITYSCDFFDAEFPLLTVGDDHYYYEPAYKPAEDEMVLINDPDSTDGISMALPAYMLALNYLHMTEGYLGVEYMETSDFAYTVSNPNFSIDPATGVVSVTVPEDTRYMECDLTVTYKYGKLAFSAYDMTVTIPLVWTNLSTEELSEYYTAAVRVGNDDDGYVTVWSQRVLKNKEFDLPTANEIKELIGWNENKYDMGTGYGSQQTEGLTLIEDEVYDFNIDYDTYSITVSGVQEANGSTTKTFYANYGEVFDFSALDSTGTTDYSDGVFTKFAGLTAPESIDLSKAIGNKMAAALDDGVTVSANYVDNSVTATFTFTGIDAEDVTVKLRRGAAPELDAAEAVVSDYGVAIVDIFPAVGGMNASGTYQVICGELDTEPATITFQENGGSEVADITKPYGSLIGSLPTSEKTGYTLEGWYADEGLTQLFELTKMPQGGATVYAKWTANEYTVTFHVNGGNALDDNEMTVTCGEAYGELPVPTKNGYGFTGWFTAAEGGEQITAESIYNLAENQTLYAHWIALVEIDAGAFDFGDAETFFYEQNVSRDAVYTVSTDVEALDGFTLEYICEGYEDEGYVAHPVNAGTWGVKVTRPADETYAKFEAFYDAVLIIEEATRKLTYLSVDVEETGFIYGNVKLADLTEIEDADENLQISFSAMDDTDIVSTSMPTDPDETHMLTGMTPGNTYTTAVYLTGERNYEDGIAHGIKDSASATIKTKSAPSGNWTRDSNYDTAWYDESATEYIIDTSAELAGLAYLSREKNVTFSGKTIKLGADIDMSAHQWDRAIGDQWEAFAGVFDGQGHTVSGLYISTSQDGAGLFGAIEGTNASRAYVKNLVLDDSYIKGTGDYVGGIVGYLIDWAQVQNCVNYAYVTGNGTAGGIVGTINYATWSYVMDCVNYGTVKSNVAGGILGASLSDSTGVMNNVNFGSVSGGYAYGIGSVPVNGRLENNYNVGRIVSTSTLSYPVAGAAISLNAGNYTTYNYYLAGCATWNGQVMNAYTNRDYYKMADGTTDSYGSHYASSFTSPDSKLLSTAGDYAGMTLIEALSVYADTYSRTAWEATGPDGYPLPVDSPVSALRK